MTTLNAGEGKVDQIATLLANSRTTCRYLGFDELDSIVRIVLTALRTPSEEMVEAALSKMRETHADGMTDQELVAFCFSSAIDVLLTPKDPNQ